MFFILLSLYNSLQAPIRGIERFGGTEYRKKSVNNYFQRGFRLLKKFRNC